MEDLLLHENQLSGVSPLRARTAIKHDLAVPLFKCVDWFFAH
jgi:hypothetical protein